MIVTTDFLDHWKTTLLIQSLNDPAAPQYVIRLWAHCQSSKRWQFEGITPDILKAICRFPGDAKAFDTAMLASRFIRREGNLLSAHNWDLHNSSLISAWTNGAKGGRPPQKAPIEQPPDNPEITHGLPDDNPPGSRYDETGFDLIGSDGTRTDKNKTPEQSALAPGNQGGDSCVVPEKLQELGDAWNLLPDGIAPRVTKLASKAILAGWKRAQADAETREALSDPDKLMAAIERQRAFLAGQGWFDFLWLFGKGRDLEWNVSKLLNGKYDDSKRSGSNGSRRGASDHKADLRFDPSEFNYGGD